MTEKQRILSEMWLAGASTHEIAARLGIPLRAVYTLRHQYRLPKRENIHQEPESPTPEEIATRARECREAHYAKRRSESDIAVRSLVWHRRQRESA